MKALWSDCPFGVSFRSGWVYLSRKTAPKWVQRWFVSFITDLAAVFSCPDSFPSSLVQVLKPYRAAEENHFFQKLKILQVPDFFYVFLSLDLGGSLRYGIHQRESLGV